MLLEIMENVRRVAVLGLKTAKVILSRVAVLESETAELISARLAVLQSKTADVILSTVAVVKFRITSQDTSVWSFVEMLYLQRRCEQKARWLIL